MYWSVGGLPAHILIIHAAVVFGPLAAVSALAYAGLPKYHDTLRWPTLVLAVIAFLAIWAAYLSGSNFFADARFDNFSGEILEKIEKHEDYASTLRWIGTGFGIVTVAATYLHDRAGTRRTVLNVLVAVLAVLTLVWVFLTGDAGSRAVWS
jgi:uncharacterized membrane protein